MEESWDTVQRRSGVEAGDQFQVEGRELRCGIERGEVGRKGEVTTQSQE